MPMLKKCLPLACVVVVACASEPGLDVEVQLSGPADTCDFFVETGVGIRVEIGPLLMLREDARHWTLNDHRVEFSFSWPDDVVDGMAGLAEFDAITNQYVAHGSSMFVSRPDEHVVAQIDAECSIESPDPPAPGLRIDGS
jgi:hypothetical protein